jgi:hypothetical protein
VIFALRHPAVLLGLLLAFLIGIPLRAACERAVAVGGISLRRRGRLRSVRPRRLRSGWTPAAGWAAYFDPYGAVAAAIAGVGWGPRPQLRRSGKTTDLRVLVVALAVHAALAAVGLAGYVAAGGHVADFGSPFFDLSSVLHGSGTFGKFGMDVAAGFAAMNIGCGLLALWPIPPLELGVLLWSRLPRGAGARRLAYHLLEEAWGVAVTLLFLLLPLAGQQPLLLELINDASRAIFKHF